MQKHSVEAIIRALNGAQVRYLIVGGLAVVAHGYLRFTADVDLIVGFEKENLKKALQALTKLGYRPRAPVSIEEFADSASRTTWIKEKGMIVFSLWSAQHEFTEIDLFVESPFDFDKAYSKAAHLELIPQLPATFVSLEDLISLKKEAGRPEDLLDIEKLKMIRGKTNDQK